MDSLTVPTMRCEPCGCSTCEPGYRVTVPLGIVHVDAVSDIGISCMDLEDQGLDGLLPEVFCNDEIRRDALFRSTCGCPELPEVEAAHSVVMGTPPEAFINIPGLVQHSESDNTGSSMNPMIIIRRNPVLVGAILVGALAVAGIYLLCQLRWSPVSEKTRSVEGTQGSDSKQDKKEEQLKGEEDLEYNARRRMIYILNDEDSISDFGSVMSYNVAL